MKTSRLEISGRELLQCLAQNVNNLCTSVDAWLDQQERLRARIAALEDCISELRATLQRSAQ